MNRIAEKIEKKRFRIEHKKTVRKWYADGGETHLRYDYDLTPESVVFDLGGYKGQWASDIFARYQSNIHVFEPVEAFAEQIERRFQKNNKIMVYPFGLGASTRMEEIHLSADGSSVWGASENTEKIRIVDVQEWMTENKPGRIALMKINIEGGEFELLERMIEGGMTDSVENFQIQFHKIAEDSRSRMEQIQQVLGKTHRLTYQYDFVWENWALKK